MRTKSPIIILSLSLSLSHACQISGTARILNGSRGYYTSDALLYTPAAAALDIRARRL